MWHVTNGEETLTINGPDSSSINLTSTGTEYQVHTLYLNEGTYTVGTKSVTVVDWDESTRYYKEATDLIVPYGVYQIGKQQYQANSIIKNVTLSPTVKDIGERAFSECTKINTVTFNEGLRVIGTYAFQSTKFNSIDIPGSVDTIGESAFNKCSSLSSAVFHKGLKTIGTNAFKSSALVSIEIPGSV